MEHDDMEISLALLYCRHNDGALCNVCPYAIHEPKCSHRLLTDASRRIRELIEEVKGHEDD